MSVPQFQSVPMHLENAPLMPDSPTSNRSFAGVALLVGLFLTAVFGWFAFVHTDATLDRASLVQVAVRAAPTAFAKPWAQTRKNAPVISGRDPVVRTQRHNINSLPTRTDDLSAEFRFPNPTSRVPEIQADVPELETTVSDQTPPVLHYEWGLWAAISSMALASILATLRYWQAGPRTRVQCTQGKCKDVRVAMMTLAPEEQKVSDIPTILSEYGTDLTLKAAQGKLDPVVGREKQIERMTQILSRRRKNNPVLVGEPGVGKTAIAEGLAQRIWMNNVPETLQGKRIICLDMALLIAGTKDRGEFEDRLTRMMVEIKTNPDIILMIDEIHTLVSAGTTEGGMDAAQILKPALSRGELQCIGATTLDEYRQHIEKDPALERRFQPVIIPEPTIDEAVEIMNGLKDRFELHHNLKYSQEAVYAAAKLSSQYIAGRYLPDKAIDVLDEAGSVVRLGELTTSQVDDSIKDEMRELKQALRELRKKKDGFLREQSYVEAREVWNEEQLLLEQFDTLMGKPWVDAQVTESHIADVVGRWTGIPINKVSNTESDTLTDLETLLHKRLIGQEDAITAVSRAIRRARAGIKNPNRPIASFIFAGPTGVGKSELAKSLAERVFGSEDAMVRLDMSEYMERHTVSKLVGAPPGYAGYDDGGQLTEAVRRRPYTVVLFDEIEKAHPDVFNMMLQILDDGHLTDSRGRMVSFKNTLILLTSNTGAKAIELLSENPNALDLDLENSAYMRVKKAVNVELKKAFKPEFLNRLDDIIVFRQLTKFEVSQIATVMLNGLFKRLEDKDLTVDMTFAYKDKLIKDGFNPIYGARPLRRAIMHLMEDVLAERLLTGDIKEGDSIIVDVNEDEDVVVITSDGRSFIANTSGDSGISAAAVTENSS